MILFLFLSTAVASTYEDAVKKAAEALYAKSPMEQHLNERFEVIKANIPKEQKKVLELVLPLLDTVTKQQLTITIPF